MTFKKINEANTSPAQGNVPPSLFKLSESTTYFLIIAKGIKSRVQKEREREKAHFRTHVGQIEACLS